MRHTKAMHLLQSGVPLVMVKDFLGHVDMKSTEVLRSGGSRDETQGSRLGKRPPTDAGTNAPSIIEPHRSGSKLCSALCNVQARTAAEIPSQKARVCAASYHDPGLTIMHTRTRLESPHGRFRRVRPESAQPVAHDRVVAFKTNTVHLITFWWYPVLGAKAAPRGHLMNVTTVESTSLATVAYDDAWELLQLEFCSRAVYQYFGVPAAVHAALLRAPSKGSYFNRVIRGRFPYSLAANAQAGVAHAALRSERSR